MTSEGDTRELLLRFLLGELPADEIDAFEQRLLSDQEFADRIAEARYDLLDAYAAGELDASTRQRVAKALLQNPRGSVGLAVAQKLQGTRVASKEPTRQPNAGWTIGRKRVWIPIAAAIALAIAGTLYVRHQKTPSTSVAGIQNPQPSHAPGRSEAAFVLLLEPQVTRGAGQPRTVVLPPQMASVEVQLVLGAQEHAGPYQVVLKSQQGQQIASLGNLQPRSLGQTRFLQVSIPARLVPSGNYHFDVYPEGSSGHLIHSYTVSIATKQTPKK